VGKDGSVYLAIRGKSTAGAIFAIRRTRLVELVMWQGRCTWSSVWSSSLHL